MYSIYVEDFMIRNVKFIYNKMTYQELKDLLLDAKHLLRFPLVDNPQKRILLGSVTRLQLIRLIEKHIGRERRLHVATLRMKAAQARAREDALRHELEQLERFSRFELVRTPRNVLVIPHVGEDTASKVGICFETKFRFSN